MQLCNTQITQSYVKDRPDFMYFIDVDILGTQHVCTHHLLKLRRIEDDRLKGRNM